MIFHIKNTLYTHSYHPISELRTYIDWPHYESYLFDNITHLQDKPKAIFFLDKVSN